MSLDVAIDHRQGDFRLQARFSAGTGLTALFGRSGSGKTTLVNVIAGLVKPEKGHVTVDGQALVDTGRRLFVPPHRRRVGYVFQEGRLFPHLTVRRNLLYGRWFTPHAERRARLDDVVEMLGIGGLLARHPASLSGGEKQRVAIGRALLASPRLLLMDEPLAALDDARKAEILPYIERLRDQAGIPIVYVSHAVVEVVRLATTVVMMQDGQVAAAGPAGEVMSRLDVASLGRAEIGALLDATVTAADDGYGLSLLATQAGELRVPALDLPVGATLRVQILARDVMIALAPPQGLSGLNMLQGTLAEIGLPQGASVDLRLDCNGAPVLAQITRRSLETLGLRVGQRLTGIVKSVTFAGR
ncbi:MAG TPA: molybdenum ABC transporter ATP-binding protein [Alphaproteobacteria bacterium]|jgi:molybdate transport system ATP-binding protein